jgi:serine protease Do
MQTPIWKRTLTGVGVIAVFGAIAVLAGGYIELRAEVNAKEPTATTAVSSLNTQTTAVPYTKANSVVAQPGFSSIVAQNGPAVVNISITGTMKTSMDMPSFPQMDPNNPFYQFFRHFQIPGPSQGETPVHGVGSGFIISSDGLILTNAHVIDNANEVTVRLTDKREFKAKVLGKDKPTDVAVLKIDASDLPTVKLGNPAQSQVGDWVLAIGSPFGFANSATAGIISAKSRSLPDDGYVTFLQTDVAVNPGNSGGPLFNSDGQVIGINSQIYTRTGGYEGLSFAIPIDVALKVEKQIIKNGKVERGLLGVTIQEVNQSLADSFGLKKPMGALVGSVEHDGPADKAGVKPGDVILKFNGTSIADSNELPPLVANMKPGSKVQLDIWRDGKHKELSVALGDLSNSKLASNDAKDNLNKSRLGVAVRPLTPEERKQDNVREGGLLVEDVAGPAAAAGIQPGDVILSLNGERISKVEQLRKLITNHGKHIALLVQRENSRIFVPVDLG